MGLFSRIFRNRKPVGEPDSEASYEKRDAEHKINELVENTQVEETIEEEKEEDLSNNHSTKLQIEKIVEFDKLGLTYKNNRNDDVRQKVRNQIINLLDSLEMEFSKKYKEGEAFARKYPNVVFASIGMIGVENVSNDLSQKYSLINKQTDNIRDKIKLAINNIGEQEIYNYIVKNCTGSEIRSETILLVKDQDVLAYSAENDVEWSNRLLALDKIIDPEVIKRIAETNSIDRIRDEAKEKLLKINKNK